MRYGLCLLLLLFSSCTTRAIQAGPPWQQEMFSKGPKGPPEFEQGWRDGCETGIAATANQLQKLDYNFRMQESLVTNDVYYNAWGLGFQYCHRYLFHYLDAEMPFTFDSDKP